MGCSSGAESSRWRAHKVHRGSAIWNAVLLFSRQVARVDGVAATPWRDSLIVALTGRRQEDDGSGDPRPHSPQRQRQHAGQR
jgi:hypothetical protein